MSSPLNDSVIPEEAFVRRLAKRNKRPEMIIGPGKIRL